MWVDWVKFWDLKDIVVPDYTCKANPDRSESDLCGAANVSLHTIHVLNKVDDNSVLVGLL